MNVFIRAGAAMAAGTLLAACGSSSYNTAPPPSGGSSSSSGSMGALSLTGGHLVGADGKSLYLWAKDTGTTSVCSGGCAAAWPPLTATTAPRVSAPLVQSKVGLSRRSDGSEQVTYAGHPLYYYAGDAAAGDTNGEGSTAFGAAWWLVSPAGSPVMSASMGASSSSTGGYRY